MLVVAQSHQPLGVVQITGVDSQLHAMVTAIAKLVVYWYES